MGSKPNLRIVAIGVFPPPATGMTLFTEKIAVALGERATVDRFNLSDGSAKIGNEFRLRKLLRFLGATLRLAFGRRSRRSVLYMPLNANKALWYNLCLALVGRVRGYQVVVHHHIYSYIEKYDWRIQWMTKLVGERGRHVVHCEQMQDDFQARYSGAPNFLFVPPTVVSQTLPSSEPTDNDPPERKTDQPFRLGFLSNLTLAKGLGRALDTLERLAEAGENVCLELGGPCMSAIERQRIDQAVAKWPDRVIYHGPMYDQEKAEFFDRLDAFLFPTEYKHESWGIVLTEAMSAGTPVIANDRGCIRWIVQEGSGRVVGRDEEFAEVAAAQIAQWIHDPQSFQTACHSALERNQVLEHQAQEELARFLDWMCLP